MADYQRTRNSTDNRLSRYVQGGLTDRYSNKLGWWERYDFPRSADVITYIISRSEAHLPHKVAYNVYGKIQLTWLVLQYNNIVDVETEFYTGRELILPLPTRVMLTMLSKPVGGNSTGT